MQQEAAIELGETDVRRDQHAQRTRVEEPDAGQIDDDIAVVVAAGVLQVFLQPLTRGQVELAGHHQHGARRLPDDLGLEILRHVGHDPS